jgi:hypothetical protein
MAFRASAVSVISSSGPSSGFDSSIDYSKYPCGEVYRLCPQLQLS